MPLQHKLIVFLLAFFQLQVLHGQTPAVNDFFAAYRDYPDVNTISVGGLVLQVASWFVDEPSAKMVIKKTRKVKILTAPHREFFHPDDITAFLSDLHLEGYEGILQMRDGNTWQNIYARADNRRIRNILVLVEEPDQFVLLSIKCKLNQSDLVDLLNEAI